MDLVPGSARRLGHSGHILFEPAMGRSAACSGGLFCPHLDMASLAVTAAAGICVFYRVVCRRGCVVDIDPAIALSTVAA